MHSWYLHHFVVPRFEKIEDHVRIHLALFNLCLFESKLAKCAMKCLSDDDVSRIDHGHSDIRTVQLRNFSEMVNLA
jgi:hypothetical protein